MIQGNTSLPPIQLNSFNGNLRKLQRGMKFYDINLKAKGVLVSFSKRKDCAAMIQNPEQSAPTSTTKQIAME